MVKFVVLVCGFDVLRKVELTIREDDCSGIAMTVYPDAYSAYRKLSRNFILKLSRLCGADIIYAGSPIWARYEKEGGPIRDAIEPVFSMHRMLSEPIPNASHVKGTLPTITNDQHPSRAEVITAWMRKQFKHYQYAFFVGGGLSGFPDNLTVSVKEWLNCLRHASVEDLSNYAPYNFDKYEAEFNKIGWTSIEVMEALHD